MTRQTRLNKILLRLIALSCMSCLPLSAQSNEPAGGLPPAPESIEEASAPVLRPGSIGPFEYATDVNPLTGLNVADASQLDRRPVVVKVSNSPALVRPQAGIGEADLVFEHYTEVGITRFSAIFYGRTPTRVGSIRSARLIDYELVPMYDALLAFAGASIGVDKRIYGSETIRQQLCAQREDREQCFQEADLVGPAGFVPPSDFVDRAYKGVLFGLPYYFRDETLPVPHNLFVNVQALAELAERDGHGQRPYLPGLAFHETPPEDAAGPGNLLQVRYRTTFVEWYYDPETALYYRSTDGQKHYDANTQTQISAANVVVLYAGHYLTDIVESQFQDTIHWSAQITLWPQGDALVLRDGQLYETRWLRSSRPEGLSFRTQDGDMFYLKPGNTWFQVFPLADQVDDSVEWVLAD